MPVDDRGFEDSPKLYLRHDSWQSLPESHEVNVVRF